MRDPQFRGGQHLSVYVAHASGDVIVAPWVKTQGQAAKARKVVNLNERFTPLG